MSELRQNLATGEWVVIAAERLKGKPLQKEPNAGMEVHPTYGPGCPFCPPNEERFPHVEVDIVPNAQSAEQDSRWRVRCIENKYKIFAPPAGGGDPPTEYERDGIYARSAGHGTHELVLESPVHNQTIATMSPPEVEAVVEMYLRRFRALRQQPHNLLSILFKNHGPKSGASQVHPHTQIMSSRVVPMRVRHLIAEATRYFDTHGVCVFCKILDYELFLGERIVYENDRFVAFAPYAQGTPYELYISPKVHDSLFEDMEDAEAAGFADCLRVTLRKLYLALSNPDFNLILRNPPHALSQVPFYHWYLRIVPHTRLPGGFERGSRIKVNVVSPEASAQHLRETNEE